MFSFFLPFGFRTILCGLVLEYAAITRLMARRCFAARMSLILADFCPFLDMGDYSNLY